MNRSESSTQTIDGLYGISFQPPLVNKQWPFLRLITLITKVRSELGIAGSRNSTKTLVELRGKKARHKKAQRAKTSGNHLCFLPFVAVFTNEAGRLQTRFDEQETNQRRG